MAAYFAGAYKLPGHTLPTILRGKFDVEFRSCSPLWEQRLWGNGPSAPYSYFFASIGHALEGFAVDRARKAIEALGSVTPKTARVRRDRKEIEVIVTELQVGDVALVKRQVS